MNKTSRLTTLGGQDRLAIFGSRTLDNAEVRAVIAKAVNRLGALIIVTAGEPHGVCEVARRYAKETAIPLKLHFANRMRYAQGMHHWRSVHVYEDCDAVSIIHDGESKGTQNEYELAQKMNIPHEYVRLEIPIAGAEAGGKFDINTKGIL